MRLEASAGDMKTRLPPADGAVDADSWKKPENPCQSFFQMLKTDFSCVL
jgi:hypothetical protein